MIKVVDDVKVHVVGANDMEDDEIREYTKIIKSKENIEAVREYSITVFEDGHVTLDPIDVDVVKFERIRRITGRDASKVAQILFI